MAFNNNSYQTKMKPNWKSNLWEAPNKYIERNIFDIDGFHFNSRIVDSNMICLNALQHLRNKMAFLQKIISF